MPENKYTKAVAIGARLLDDEKPGWAALIRLDVLSMNNPCRCILGQIFENLKFDESGYRIGRCKLGFGPFAIADDDRDPGIAAGFDIVSVAYQVSDRETRMAVEYTLLQDAWIDAIRARITPPVSTPAGELHDQNQRTDRSEKLLEQSQG